MWGQLFTDAAVVQFRTQLSLIALGSVYADQHFEKRLEAMLRKLGKGRREAATKDWSSWAQTAMVKGAGAAHKWANSPNVAQPGMMTTPSGSCAPAHLAEQARDTWASKWHSDDARKVQETLEVLRQKRHLLIEEDTEDQERYSELLAPTAIMASALSC